MKIKIYLNRTYKKSCNLINFELNASYFKIDKNKDNKTILVIDGIIYVDNGNILNSLDFLVQGYTSSISFNNNVIKGTELEYKKKTIYKNFIDAINFIKNM